MKRFLIAVLTLVLALSSCADNSLPKLQPKAEYKKITAIQAKEIIDTQKNFTILDVRTKEEFDTGHIKNAVLLPDYDVEALAPTVLKDKNAKILIYCRSGRRSALAAQKLIDMGYTDVYDFGGIIDWKYEIEY